MNTLQEVAEAAPVVSAEQEVEAVAAVAVEPERDMSEQLTSTSETSLPSLPSPSGGEACEGTFRSDDPRTPANASRSGELVSGDFAWMMGEGGEACGGASGSS